ncbi:hypothetical protein [Roseovarius sp. EL26]|uniref:hypothetical protein n=1 Tax=Roseovarius sp. EL26 TaxID=2126672 RepID=UPI000EA0652D|nr:hypothetical protein [Roseovarius sp. EL26]
MSDKTTSFQNYTPPDLTPAQSGVAAEKQSSEVEILDNFTEGPFSDRPLALKLSELGDRNSGTFGGRVSTQITVAAYLQLERELAERKAEITDNRNDIHDLIDQKTELKIALAKKQSETQSLGKVNWICTAIYALATLLISIGSSDFENDQGKVILIVGCLLFLIGFATPLIHSRGSNND